MSYVRLKIAVMAIAFSAAAAPAGHAENSRHPQLQLVPRRIGTRLHACAAIGRTATAIHRNAADGLQRAHARQSIFENVYVGRRGKSQSSDGARPGGILFNAVPRAANDGDKELAAEGRSIYQEGMPDANTAACVVCHGPNAEGVRGIPRLGGLAYSYLKRRLEQWGEGYHAAAGPPMPGIASKLSQNQIKALASYLSFVK